MNYEYEIYSAPKTPKPLTLALQAAREKIRERGQFIPRLSDGRKIPVLKRPLTPEAAADRL